MSPSRGSGVAALVGPGVGFEIFGAWPGSLKVGLLLIGHCLRRYDLAIAVDGVEGVFEELHADDRGAGALMLLQDDGLALAVVNDLAKAIVCVGKADSRVRESAFGIGARHGTSPSGARQKAVRVLDVGKVAKMAKMAR
ncbi:hypothetical protein [Novosphingobium sp. 9U]|uniref:hypothetical protein n=1 Tax=Novosphingobium sp. 9U TaxID=2653158 RepID=UPI0012F4046F|nr:hypothetical protein [Novosphingobium sp. 9U]VWX51058.1 hypothetical protein NOVOSPHI9U_370062 [Novosphingobium sp. 9U]